MEMSSESKVIGKRTRGKSSHIIATATTMNGALHTLTPHQESKESNSDEEGKPTKIRKNIEDRREQSRNWNDGGIEAGHEPPNDTLWHPPSRKDVSNPYSFEEDLYPYSEEDLFGISHPFNNDIVELDYTAFVFENASDITSEASSSRVCSRTTSDSATKAIRNPCELALVYVNVV